MNSDDNFGEAVVVDFLLLPVAHYCFAFDVDFVDDYVAAFVADVAFDVVVVAVDFVVFVDVDDDLDVGDDAVVDVAHTVGVVDVVGDTDVTWAFWYTAHYSYTPLQPHTPRLVTRSTCSPTSEMPHYL